MKILHLLASNGYSGAEHVVIDIIKNLQDRHSFVYVSPDGPIAQVLAERKITFVAIKSFGYIEIYDVIRRYKPDIIHAHDYRASCIAALMPFSGKIISHIHNNSLWAKRLDLRTILYWLALKRFSKVVVVSQPVINEFFFSSVLKTKAYVISNVINANEILHLARDGISDIISSDILFVGRLSQAKNPVGFIEIIDKIRSFLPNVRVLMVGSGELEEECMILIRKKKLDNNIKLMGFQKNPYIFMKNTKVLLVPSLWEGFGLVALEAMILGTPVISTPVGGLKRIIGGFNQEWACSNIQDFVMQILKILNSDYNSIMQKSLQRYAEKINDFDGFVKQCNELYCGEFHNE